MVKEKSMERYAMIMRPGEEMMLLHCWPGDTLELQMMQEIVGGYIETVPVELDEKWSGEAGVGLQMIINEEGKLMGLPLNVAATEMANLRKDCIVGTAILMGVKGENLIGLTREAAVNIAEKWRKGTC